jgi:hypothetical protein
LDIARVLTTLHAACHALDENRGEQWVLTGNLL